jgi:hypothetical protein
VSIRDQDKNNTAVLSFVSFPKIKVPNNFRLSRKNSYLHAAVGFCKAAIINSFHPSWMFFVIFFRKNKTFEPMACYVNVVTLKTNNLAFLRKANH